MHLFWNAVINTKVCRVGKIHNQCPFVGLMVLGGDPKSVNVSMWDVCFAERANNTFFNDLYLEIIIHHLGVFKGSC